MAGGRLKKETIGTCCRLSKRRILERIGNSRRPLAGRRIDRGRGGCKPGRLARKGGGAAIRVFLRRCGSFLIVVLVVTTVTSKFVKSVRDTTIVIVIVAVGTVLKAIRAMGTRSSLTDLGGLSNPRTGILHSKIIIPVPSSRIAIKSVVVLRTKSCVPTSKHVLRYTDVGISRDTLAKRDLNIRGAASIVRRSRIPLKSHVGVMCSKDFLACKENSFMIARVKVGARINGVTDLLGAASRGGAPLRIGLSRFKRGLSVLVLMFYTVLFKVDIFHNRGVKGTFLFTITLTITTVPRTLDSVIAVILSFKARGVTGRRTVIQGLRTMRKLKDMSVVYSSGAKALARGGVAMRRCCMSNRDVSTSGVSLQSPSRDELLVDDVLYGSSAGVSNMRVKSPARATLVGLKDDLNLSPRRIEMGCPERDRGPFSDSHGVVTAGRSLGKIPAVVIGKTISILLGQAS